MTWKKLLLPAVLCAASLCHLTAGDFPLVKDGKAANIVVGEYFVGNQTCKVTEMSGGASFAARELADYTERTTGIRPTISLEAAKDRPNIYLFQWSIYSNPPVKGGKLNVIRSLMRGVREDGFYLYADENTAYVIGKRTRSVIFGACEVLRKYAEVRWLFPGKDGESVIHKDSIIIPEQSKVYNPSIDGRTFNLVCANVNTPAETALWMTRNKMDSWLIDPEVSIGGHCFCHLMPDTNFPDHPECFGLYGGKRMPQCGVIYDDPKKYSHFGQSNQPCTSNPKTKEIMLQNLLIWLGKTHADSFNLTNNDTTIWCECENCKKLDPPEEAKRGHVSTRFWDLANYLVAGARKVYPKVKFNMSAYQNYQEPPAHLKPINGVSVGLCVHHRCYVHDISDPKCELNARYRNLIDRWSALGTTVATYEYSEELPYTDVAYLPLEGVMARDLKYYASKHNSGYCDETPPWDGTYGDRFQNRRILESWKANALVRYVQASFMWDANQNLDDVIEEFGSRYYGKAWPAMKKYRTLLRTSYENSDSHFTYGTQGIALGKCIADEKIFAELNSLLAQAVKEAEGDAVVLKRVKDEKEYFDLSFGVTRKQYLSQRQTVCEANHTTGRIVIDGEFSEADWAKAVPVDDFRVFDSNGKKAVAKTEARALWDENNLYLAVKVFDKDRPEINPADKPTRDAQGFWKEKYPSVEFFFTSPNWGTKYLHWVTNSNGSIWDAMTLSPVDSQSSYNADAEVRTKNIPDGWQVEIRMPFRSLGNMIPKQGMRLRVNIARSATVNGNWEGSSWSNGAFHGSDGYREILFK